MSASASAMTLRVLLALLAPTLATATEEPMPDGWLETFVNEDAALFMMQSTASMRSGPRGILATAASASNKAEASASMDSIFFAQTSLEVDPARASGGVASGARPAWLPDAPAEEDNTCSLEGLSPGVCAIAALARSAPTADGQPELDLVNPERLERALFQEIEAALAGTHSGFSAEHLDKVEQSLAGLFSGLPKNAAGRLEHDTVRYAMHQHFVRTHAWYIRSLNPVGEAQTPASAAEELRGQVPQHLQKLLEAREGGRGLAVRELAVFVATLEHLIQGDLVERLKAAYSAHGLATNGTASREDVVDALQTYMAHFLSLKHRSGYAVTPEMAAKERRLVERGYQGWEQVVASTNQSVARRLPTEPQATLPFSEALAAAADLMSSFDRIYEQDCLGIKRDLVAMPNGGSGRVLLSDLRWKALEGSMIFSESTEYLDTLGALEEDKHGAVSVLVPNYVYSPSNCVGTTSFFDMCCPNQCEAALAQLESAVGKPEATPAEVEAVLAMRPWDGPLSDIELEELDDMAHARNGRVPLHGHAFALWLHHTYPGECPKPRVEDFAGARKDAEVPAAATEYQAVASLPSIVASRSDLIAELLQGEAEEQEVVQGPVHPSQVSSGGDLSLDDLREIVANKLATAGLKLRSRLDTASLAQTGLEVTEATSEEPQSEEKTLGLKLKRRP